VRVKKKTCRKRQIDNQKRRKKENKLITWRKVPERKGTRPGTWEKPELLLSTGKKSIGQKEPSGKFVRGGKKRLYGGADGRGSKI